MKLNSVGSNKLIIIAKAKVNGKGPSDFAVDTAASVTALSEQLTQKLEIPENENNLKKRAKLLWRN
jgi:predicted aspartyl protease